MGVMRYGLAIAFVAACCSLTALAADKKNEFRYNVGPGASVTIVNEFGPVTVKGSSSRQVVITAISRSDKVQVECNQTANRVQAVSHVLQPNVSDTDSQVEYEVTVPQDAAVTVRAAGGPITAERLRGDVSLEGDAARIEARDIADAHVHVRTVSGPVTLSNISNGHVEVTSVSGDVQMNSVSGRKVSASTAKGAIRYVGDFGSGGDYLLVNHSGDIDVTLPTTASVDLSARSVSGSVEQDFPLQQKSHPSFPQTSRSFAGTSNSGASSVQLRSFSGKIRVKKQ